MQIDWREKPRLSDQAGKLAEDLEKLADEGEF
jgi:hypothetical protein